MSEGYFKEIYRGIVVKLGVLEIIYLGKYNKCKLYYVYVLLWNEILLYFVFVIVGYSFVWYCSVVCVVEEVFL